MCKELGEKHLVKNSAGGGSYVVVYICFVFTGVVDAVVVDVVRGYV